ncbi:MAG TPA: hypothetical protein VGH28_23185 [Polyangiaceae bacterium]|jgi:hypothetical protein
MATKLIAALGVAALATACLTRPVTQGNPVRKEAIAQQIKSQSVDKVDLLFAIDNSSSMGDKQDLLASAVPALVDQLVNPSCVSTVVTSCTTASDCTAALGPKAQCDGQCFVAGDDQGSSTQCSTIPNTKPRFPPIHDLHVGIVSSSLGGGGSPDVCVPDQTDSTHMNDGGHLLSRTPTGALPDDFLAWAPAQNPTQTLSSFVSDFQSLVEGVGQHGCGLEAQLESWYRFLVQPDPWNAITTTTDSPPRSKYDGVDATLLKMRHDFLRPDSLVAVIQLTDEEDSWSDPLWDGDSQNGGYGWLTRTNNFPFGPDDNSGVGPRGTHECDANPNDPDCMSCLVPTAKKPVSGQTVGDDPNCTSCIDGTNCKPGWWTPATPTTPIEAADGLNVRYGNQTMKRRYGFDNQHSIQRYIDGLRSTRVPDRDHESHDASNYAPNKNCTNPLFAASLPDGSDTSPDTLCNLPYGSRTQDLIFYALIGGVPSDLVGDWTKILGADPEHGDLSGIDPRMIESTAPRAGLPSPTSGAPNREWNTLESSAHIDLQYACTFDLPSPRVCAPEDTSCDCASPTPDGSPLCNGTTQIKGKAYPTIRELRVAKGLGVQAVVGSLCASVVTGDTSDPSYGYNPAMRAIVARLSTQLHADCLPQALAVASDGSVPCSVLALYQSQTDQSAGCTDPGMCNPAVPSSCGCAPGDDICAAGYEGILSRFTQQYRQELGDAGASAPVPVVCVYKQLLPQVDYSSASCADSQQSGWCYVQGSANTGGCTQAIQFGNGGPPSGTTIDLECIE